ncbi:MAG: hypothetical protein KDA87_07160 [Planctomycetales bacterium]|nr:hypothetical protein [Planctomycetales bacterium]
MLKRFVLGTLIALVSSSVLLAGEECKECKKECAKCTSECQECPISKAMAKLPQLTYLVGSEKTCCPDAAAALAKKDSQTVKYVVVDKTFDQECDAMLSLAEQTEQFVAKFAEPCKCEVSGNISVAGITTQCDVSAGKTSELVKAAMETVKVSYLVGDEPCCCANSAKALAEKNNADIVYVVGEEKASCEIKHRINVARAKYKAAVEASMKAQAEVATTSTEKTSS